MQSRILPALQRERQQRKDSKGYCHACDGHLQHQVPACAIIFAIAATITAIAATMTAIAANPIYYVYTNRDTNCKRKREVVQAAKPVAGIEKQIHWSLGTIVLITPMYDIL